MTSPPPTIHATLDADVQRTYAALWQTLAVSDAIAGGSPELTIRPGGETRSGREVVPELVGLATLTLDGEDGQAPSADIHLRGVIGRGGMGVVQSALQRSLQREVAVKQLLPHATEPRHAQGLLREARITGQLEHPNIVPVHALGLDRLGRPVLVMKRISGTSWLEALRERDLRLRAHIQTLIQVCHAIEFAHANGVIHRDIKPENVMIGAYGEVYVLDWGIALRADEAQADSKIAGTPAYMAPEQAEGGAITPLTDVYLLGATLHEILTGRARHQGDTVFNVMLNASVSAPAVFDASIPQELAAICNRATAAAPHARYSSVQALRRALEDSLEHMTSFELAQTALERLEALERLLDAPLDSTSSTGAERDNLYRLFAECRFGFQQALRVWPGNAAAAEGLERALGLSARSELDAGNLGGAEIAVAEMTAPSPELRERLEHLRQATDAKRARLVELETLQAGMDLRISGRSRAAVVVVLGVALTILSIIITVGAEVGAILISWPQMLLTAVGCAAVYAAVLLVLRKRVRWTRINRTTAWMGAALIFNMILLRAVAWATGIEIYQGFVLELMLLFAEVLLCGIMLDHRISWALPPFVLTCIPAFIWPATILATFSLATSTLVMSVAWIWYRNGLAAQADASVAT